MPLPSDDLILWDVRPPCYSRDRPAWGSEEEQDTWDEEREVAIEYYESMADRGGVDFRSVPDDEFMLPLLSAFARSIARMPALEEAHLQSCLASPHKRDVGWMVDYCAPWKPYKWNRQSEHESDLASPRVIFDVGNEWRPSEEVLDLFREVGSKKYGRDTVLEFVIRR